jgi:hypothetical protein
MRTARSVIKYRAGLWSAPGVSHPSAASILLLIGPLLVVLVWFLTGQWGSAGPESRAWLQFAGLLCLASLTPLPRRPTSLAKMLAHLRWWGWAGIVGLLVTS